MKNAVIIFLIVVVVLIGSSGYFLYGHFSKETNRLKEELIKSRNEYTFYALREKRIKYMTKALIATYGLSKWEAHYYSIIFDDFSCSYEIPWEIYPAIIRIESNFKCTLVSSKGAKGIMQILESTGENLAGKMNIEYTESSTLWNDIINLILGCRYLSDNIKRQGLESGVKSYLGGSGYLKTISNKETGKKVEKYIGEYKSSVWKEFTNLSYIYRGIVNEFGDDYRIIHPLAYPDTNQMDLNLFERQDTLK